MTDCGGSVRRWGASVLLAAAAVAVAWPATRARAVGGLDTTGCYAFSDTIAPLDGNAPTFSFFDIAATGTQLFLFDDQVSSAIPIGFSFNFYGFVYSSVFISSNGFITFVPNQDSGCCEGRPIPFGPS